MLDERLAGHITRFLQYILYVLHQRERALLTWRTVGCVEAVPDGVNALRMAAAVRVVL